MWKLMIGMVLWALKYLWTGKWEQRKARRNYRGQHKYGTPGLVYCLQLNSRVQTNYMYIKTGR
jgi:hypothetical protein